MARYRTYEFDPVNPDKYTGPTTPVILKSSWELEFAKHCDLLPSVLSWGYELVQVPYRDPLTGKQKIYIPDFFVKIGRTDGYAQDYVFEIKPMHEQLDAHARTQHDAALIARNNAKWIAASQWADRHSAEFQVINENDMFGGHNARKGRVNAVNTFAHTNTAKAKKMATKNKSLAARVSNKGAMSKLRSRIGKATTNKTPKVGRTARVKRR